MRNIVLRESFRDAHSIQERLTGTLAEMQLREGRAANGGRATHLFALFDYWQAIGEGRPVWHGRFAPDRIPALVGRVSYVEVNESVPLNWRFTDHQESLVPGAGREMSGQRVRDLPIASHAIYCAREYEQCRIERTAFYHELDVVGAGVHRNYLRLMVPLCDLDGRVVRIAYAFRRLLEADGTRTQLALDPA